MARAASLVPCTLNLVPLELAHAAHGVGNVVYVTSVALGFFVSVFRDGN